MPPSKFDAPLRNVCRKASQCIPPTSPCVVCPLRGVKSLFSLFYVVGVMKAACIARVDRAELGLKNEIFGLDISPKCGKSLPVDAQTKCGDVSADERR